MHKEDVIRMIDGEMWYKSHYTYFLYQEILKRDDKINKAIVYIDELISDTKGIINAYNYEDKEDTIKRYIEDLQTDINNYEYLEYILRGEDNEQNK